MCVYVPCAVGRGGVYVVSVCVQCVWCVYAGYVQYVCIGGMCLCKQGVSAMCGAEV